MTTAAPRLPRIAIVGPSRVGKDTAAQWFAENTPLRYAGTFSDVACELIAAASLSSVESVRAVRHEIAPLIDQVCDCLRARDPAALFRLTLPRGEVVTGARKVAEVQAAIDEKLIDYVIEIDRSGTVDPSYEPRMCEVANWVVGNDGTVKDLCYELALVWDNIANYWGLTEPTT